MLFMNEFEIGEALDRYRSHPVLGKAARFLARYREQVNQHSDGWPYWSAPVRAAAKLMTLLQDANKARFHYDRDRYSFRASDYTAPSEADLRAALRPIKAFYTRRGYAAGMVFPELDAVAESESVSVSARLRQALANLGFQEISDKDVAVALVDAGLALVDAK